MRIMVIDDEPVFLEIMGHMLAKYGERDVTFAASGAEALAFIERSVIPFDLFLVDIQMPSMNGIELVAAIRKISSCASTPITMVTKVAERTSVDKAFAAGATDYLTKPLDELEFRARIGVMQRVNAERQQNETLKQAFQQHGRNGRKVDFEEALSLPSADFLIELPVLRNYLEAMGRVDRIPLSALAFNVENLATIYARCDNDLFVDVVEDLAMNLFDAIRTRVAMVSYAGGGKFICVFKRSSSIDTGEMIGAVEDKIRESGEFYVRNALPLPAIRSGQFIRFSIFGRKSVDQVLDGAMKSARHLSSGPARDMRKIA